MAATSAPASPRRTSSAMCRLATSIASGALGPAASATSLAAAASGTGRASSTDRRPAMGPCAPGRAPSARCATPTLAPSTACGAIGSHGVRARSLAARVRRTARGPYCWRLPMAAPRASPAGPSRRGIATGTSSAPSIASGRIGMSGRSALWSAARACGRGRGPSSSRSMVGSPVATQTRRSNRNARPSERIVPRSRRSSAKRIAKRQDPASLTSERPASPSPPRAATASARFWERCFSRQRTRRPSRSTVTGCTRTRH
mmetsp:Transcript_129273/g.374305  ORF Transcript_129273/g.374305 Transcript_129273/m.374305 type:complete len:259 (+) Transcript_129273:683-1459(+)